MAKKFSLEAVLSLTDKMTAPLMGTQSKMLGFSARMNKTFGGLKKGASGAGDIFKGSFLGSLTGNLAGQALGFIKTIPAQLEAIGAKGEEIARTAKIIGIGTDELQKFRYAAKLTDTNVEGMERALKKMNVGMGQLRVGTGPMAESLKKLNPILAKQLKTTRSSQEAFMLVADAVVHTNSAQQRAAIATTVFGNKVGQDMIPMLLKGRAGMEELMGAASKYGGIMDEEAISASEQFSDALKKTSGVMQSLKNSAITPLLKAITPYLDDVVEWITQNKLLLKQKIKEFVQDAAKAIKEMLPTLIWLGRTIIDVIKFLAPFSPALLALAVAFKVVSIAMGIFNIIAMASPFELIVVGIMAAIAAITLLIANWDSTNKWIIIVKKSMMSLIAIGLFPLITAINTILLGLSAMGKLFGMDTKKLDAFQAGMNDFIMKNTFISGTMSTGEYDAAKAASVRYASPTTRGSESRTYAETRSTSEVFVRPDRGAVVSPTRGGAPVPSLNLGGRQ